jgi:aminoglycoside 6'-N-acetyltransferase I
VTVSVRDARRSQADRRWIESVYREYLDDLAPLNTGLFPMLAEIGHSEPDQLTRWFADSSAFPLLIMQGEKPVGFAMVARKGARPGQSQVDYRMAEFFISGAVRRLGVGASAVRIVLDRFAGRWEVVEYLRNPGAVSFWRRTLRAYTQGRLVERIENGEVRHTFASGPQRAPSA